MQVTVGQKTVVCGTSLTDRQGFFVDVVDKYQNLCADRFSATTMPDFTCEGLQKEGIRVRLAAVDIVALLFTRLCGFCCMCCNVMCQRAFSWRVVCRKRGGGGALCCMYSSVFMCSCVFALFLLITALHGSGPPAIAGWAHHVARMA